MKAFHSVRTEMRENAMALTDPGQPPAEVARLARGSPEGEEDSPIEWWMEGAFKGLTHASETGAPYALVPCYMNGEPAVVIALARPEGKRIHMMPLFLACQPWMNFSGKPGDGEEEGGGPDRTADENGPVPD
jgi:hypothetical protein